MNIGKVFKKLFINIILGVILLIIINFVGSYFSFRIALNVYSALIVGVLGVPGLILLVFLKFMV